MSFPPPPHRENYPLASLETRQDGDRWRGGGTGAPGTAAHLAAGTERVTEGPSRPPDCGATDSAAEFAMPELFVNVPSRSPPLPQVQGWLLTAPRPSAAGLRLRLRPRPRPTAAATGSPGCRLPTHMTPAGSRASLHLQALVIPPPRLPDFFLIHSSFPPPHPFSFYLFFFLLLFFF